MLVCVMPHQVLRKFEVVKLQEKAGRNGVTRIVSRAMSPESPRPRKAQKRIWRTLLSSGMTLGNHTSVVPCCAPVRVHTVL